MQHYPTRYEPQAAPAVTGLGTQQQQPGTPGTQSPAGCALQESPVQPGAVPIAELAVSLPLSGSPAPAPAPVASPAPESVKGTLILTNYRIIFAPDPPTTQQQEVIEVPFSVISRAVTLGGQPGRMDFIWGAQTGKPDDNTVEITTAAIYMDLLHPTLRFVFDTPCKDLCDFIVKLAFPATPRDHFAFAFQPTCTCRCCCCITCASKCANRCCVGHSACCALSASPPDAPTQQHCALCCIAPPNLEQQAATAPVAATTAPGEAPAAQGRFYDVEVEFARQRLELSPNGTWKVTHANQKFGLCRTYPPLLVVPAAVADADLKAVAAFRAKSRVPVLSWWKHPGVTITRGSQPKVGMFYSRSTEDECMLKQIRLANPANDTLYILDSRPQANGYVNQALGGGFETSSYYVGCSLEFLNMPNIHAVRDSFLRLRDLCASVSPQSTCHSWLSQLGSSAWLDNLRTILLGTLRIVRLVNEENASVFVHCSDAWDRTSQLCALAELCLDPYYRTVRGFCVLVEKEWLQMGHRFRDRFREVSNGGSIYETSPVFLQFLECVFQLQHQYEDAFQFTDSFLVALMEEAMLGRFQTFLFNCEAERVECPGGASVWDHLHHLASMPRPPSSLEVPQQPQQQGCFLNPHYEPQGAAVIVPKTEPYNLALWAGFYLRLLPQAGAVAESVDHQTYKALQMRQRIGELESEVAFLRAQQAQALAQEHRPTPALAQAQSSDTSETEEGWFNVPS
eukprot:TRINITY_DN7114_c0_g1_i3.p1 TRINITY_DN7114_c0_g1~~TRINITY_DN7114_c0_g1_i3.p1  ORF type:complete len:738 (+),score=177.91 TRINITY_DN7114_c0_g1_i3:351-2564(+)